MSARDRAWSMVPAVLAFCLGPLAFLLSLRVTGVTPFGSRSRSINDLGFQFEPFHARLWDLLHGHTSGGVVFNWQSGLGVGFIPDFATYVASPFALLVGLFPRTEIVLAVLVITAVKYGAAAAAMTVYLRALRPGGSWWLATLLGVAYGTCGWALDDASYVPMWIDGLIGLPLIALAGHWRLERRYALWAPVVVALVWWSNYYIAWMATLGAGLLVLAEALSRTDLTSRAKGLLSGAVAVVVGVALTSVTLVPTLLAVRAARQAVGDDAPFVRRPVRDILARLLPVSEGALVTPSVYVGTAVLALALSLPWVKGVEWRTRAAYGLTLVALVASILSTPTLLVWNGFDVPQGSPYRQAFVVCAALVVVAWLAANGRPTWALLAGVASVVAIVVLAHGSPLSGPHGRRWTALSMLLLAGIGLLGTSRSRRQHTARAFLIAMLVATFGAEQAVTAVHVAATRDDRFPPFPPVWGPEDRVLLDQVGQSDTPVGSTTRRAISDAATPNAPLLYGYRGSGYYSSTIPASTASALIRLGHRYEGFGRRIWESGDRVILAIEGISGLTSRQSGVTEPLPALPLVTAHGRGSPTEAPASTPFAAQDVALGHPVHRRPKEVTLDLGDGVGPRAGDLPRSAPIGPAGAVLRVVCAPDSVVQAWLPDQGGRLRSGADDWTLLARTQTPGPGAYARNGVISVQADSTGVAELRILDSTSLALPSEPAACVDPAILEAALAEASEQAPSVLVTGSTVAAHWPRPVSGLAVLSITATAGWSCTVDGAPADSTTVAGLLAVPLSDTHAMSCSFRQPGLTAGLLVSILAAIMASLAHPRVWTRLAHRRVASGRGAAGPKQSREAIWP